MKKLSKLLEILKMLFLPFICLPVHFKLLEKRELRWWKWRPIMWCGYIYCSTGFDMTLKHKREWVHLNIHLQQARTHYVTWLGYYLSYWIDTFLGLLWTGSLVGGRLTGKWECEAYARENDPDYLYNYQYERIRRYTFTLPERRQLWNNIKGNSERWTELLKKL